MKKAIIFITLVCVPCASAKIELHGLFSDNMVLQRDKTINIWGWGKPGENITLIFADQSKSTSAGQDGKWQITLNPVNKQGPYKMTVRNTHELIEIKNILVGDVWICAGQSNMQFALFKSLKGEETIRAADYPRLRHFTITPATSLQPQSNCHGNWHICEPNTESLKLFSAVGFYFGKEIHETQNVPVGLIDTSWGGTKAEAWVDKHALQSDPVLVPIIERAKTSSSIDIIKSQLHKNTPTVLYNAMINPLIPFSIKGVIWYQGEGNGSRGFQYQTLFPSLIQCWRNNWQQGVFPFYFVQLSSWQHPNNFDPLLWPELREAQLMTLKLPNTGMAVTIDIGDPNDIHPKNKYDVGHRLALWARANTYGEQNLVYSGPLYKRMEKKQGKINIYFDHVGSGLTFKGNKLGGFTIAGENKLFIEAQAEIISDHVCVWSSKIDNPLAVRYAWHEYPKSANLFNKELLPASPFRTDDWQGASFHNR